MAKMQHSNWYSEHFSDTEIYAAIGDLDPDRGSASKQLPQLTDTEISAAIRYLEPDPKRAKQGDRAAFFVMCGILLTLLLGYLGIGWFYR
jgi:hypothetical protein